MRGTRTYLGYCGPNRYLLRRAKIAQDKPKVRERGVCFRGSFSQIWAGRRGDLGGVRIPQSGLQVRNPLASVVPLVGFRIQIFSVLRGRGPTETAKPQSLDARLLESRGTWAAPTFRSSPALAKLRWRYALFGRSGDRRIQDARYTHLPTSWRLRQQHLRRKAAEAT